MFGSGIFGVKHPVSGVRRSGEGSSEPGVERGVLTVGCWVSGAASFLRRLGVVCLLAAPVHAGERMVLDGVAAHVNEHVVTVGEIAELVEPVNRQLRNTYSGKDLDEKLRVAFEDALESVVARYLILDAYAGQDGKIPEWAVDRRIDEIVRETCNGERSVLMEKLARDRMSFDDLRTKVREGIVVSAMRGENVARNVNISPKVVHEAYLRNREKYMRTARLKLRMIVLPIPADRDGAAKARQQADDMAGRLRDGADFAAMAKSMSKGAKADDGGDWGWIDPAETLRMELARAAEKLAPTEVSRVLEVEDQLYILKVEGRRAAAPAPFEEVQPELVRELRQKEFERIFRAWIGRLKEGAYIKIFAQPTT